MIPITFQPLFSNPALETLFQVSASLYRQKLSNSKAQQMFRTGTLEISYQSLHFSSTDCSFVVTLPFVAIKKIEKAKTLGTIIVTLLRKDARDFFIVMEDGSIPSIICQLFEISKQVDDHDPVNVLISEVPKDPLWETKQSYFKPKLKEKDKELLGMWENYLNFYGRGCTIIRTRSLVDLILKGIPNSLRRNYFFFYFSQSFYCKCKRNFLKVLFQTVLLSTFELIIRKFKNEKET